MLLAFGCVLFLAAVVGWLGWWAEQPNSEEPR